MGNLIYRNEKVLLTQQLGDVLGTNPKNINRNFQRNVGSFIEGEHYFKLVEEDLKAFKQELKNPDYLKFSSVLILWTLPGAKLIAKCCRTDKAQAAIIEKLDLIL